MNWRLFPHGRAFGPATVQPATGRSRHGFRHGLAGAFAAVALALPLAASAQEADEPVAPRAVIELFTSQGCSSCPAADRLFVELARDPRILVLTLPVDYWDYLGWKDTLADAAFTRRQRQYAKIRGDVQVYTPQAVVNGRAHVVGSDRAAIMEQVKATAPRMPVEVRVRQNGENFVVQLAGATEAERGSVWVVPVARSRVVTVKRGENKGREIHYANVARGLVRIGDWSGGAQSFEVPRGLAITVDADTFAVLIHANDGRIGRVLGAGRAPDF